MLAASNLIPTARLPDGDLVGVGRCISDNGIACYIGDLAVSKEVQRRGIGGKLVDRARKECGPEMVVIFVKRAREGRVLWEVGDEEGWELFSFCESGESVEAFCCTESFSSVMDALSSLGVNIHSAVRKSECC
ncbi:hypothetical protein K432DRAFT_443939 [Lepidopterella palustris CBS 459.81]|uniref:N-acetyltransferase domain-containing protein n=1 Tax=Lepidopterella palustris CBS 459.81 TaxID=1314670 RepID=A0A8E2E8I4_9PEZI|nr:hypothetical protein K432DRAFT_443939 [Lepidopterella palustris CBS 459.81]